MYGSNMYSYGTIMNPLGVKEVKRCPFEVTAPFTSCCTPKGTIFAQFIFLTVVVFAICLCVCVCVRERECVIGISLCQMMRMLNIPSLNVIV